METVIEKQLISTRKIGMPFTFSQVFIVCMAFLWSVILYGAIRLKVDSDVIFTIRLHRYVGWSSLIFLYVFFVLGSLRSLGVDHPGVRNGSVERSFLVVGAYFAGLHGFLGATERIGGITEFMLLPAIFQWSVVFGVSGLVLVFVMLAGLLFGLTNIASSKAWLGVNVFGRLAGYFAFLHVWMIGVHVTQRPVYELFFAGLCLLLFLDGYRVLKGYIQARSARIRMQAIVILCAFVIAVVALIPVRVTSYNQLHVHDESAEFGGGHNH